MFFLASSFVNARTADRVAMAGCVVEVELVLGLLVIGDDVIAAYVLWSSIVTNTAAVSCIESSACIYRDLCVLHLGQMSSSSDLNSDLNEGVSKVLPYMICL